MRAADPCRRRRSSWRSPGSRARSVRTCQGLRPRRVVGALAMARSGMLPSAFKTASAPGITELSRLDGWPMRTPVNASPCTSRCTAHDSGPMWFATPSSQWTCTTYSLPVSRRTLNFGLRPKPIVAYRRLPARQQPLRLELLDRHGPPAVSCSLRARIATVQHECSQGPQPAKAPRESC